MAGVGTSKGVSKPVQADTTTDSQGTSNAMSDYKAFYSAIAKSPTLTKAWSKLLKSAGYYKGPITDKYNPKLQRALDAAEQDRLTISAVRPLDRNAFINEQIQMGGAGQGSADFQRKIISSPTEAASLINAIIRDRDKREATADEIKKYTAMLQKAQASNPLQYTDTAGAGYTQTGGLDAQQYLIDQIAATDEAKANRVLGYYNTFMNALGSK